METSSTISSNWSQSSGSHTAGDVRQIQALQSEVNHLRTMVNTLTVTIDTKDQQLQDALATAGTVNGLHEEITSLKLQIRDMKANSVQKERALKSQLAEITSKAEEEKEIHNKVNEKQNNEILKNKNTIKTVTEERDQLKEELETVKGELKGTAERLHKVSKQRSKAREHVKSLQEELEALTEKHTTLTSTQEQLALENKAQAEQIDQLKEEVESLKKTLNTTKASLSTKTHEAENLEQSLESLRAQYDTQKADLEEISNEREKLIEAVRKLNAASAEYEEQLTALSGENKTLAARSRRANAQVAQMSSDAFDFASLRLPFTGDLQKKAEGIRGLGHFQTTQKVQLVLNEAAKALKAAEADRAAAKEESEKAMAETEKLRALLGRTSDTLSSIAREWKNLEFNEQRIDAVAFCECDQNFLDFVANQCVKLDNLSEAAEFLGPLFVDGDLFGDESVDERRKLIEEVASTNKELSTIISAMFLANTRLKKQVTDLLNSNSLKEEVEEVLNGLGVEDFTQLPAIVEALQKEIKHLKSTRKEVHTALVSARNDIRSKMENECALQAQIENLKKKINELRAEIAQLKAEKEIRHQFTYKTNNGLVSVPPTPPSKNQCQQLQLCQSHSQTMSTEDSITPPSTPPSFKESSSTASQPAVQPVIVQVPSQCQCQGQYENTISNLQHTISRLKKALAEKSQELENLQQKLREAESRAVKAEQHEHEVYESASAAIADEKSQAARNEQALRQQLKELEEAASKADQKLERTRRKAKSAVRELKRKQEAEIEALNEEAEGTKRVLQESLEEAKSKLEKACGIVRQLQASVEEAERRGYEASAEAERQRAATRGVEQRLASVTEQMQREQKTLQATMSAKLMSAETAHQKEVKEAKAKLQGEKQAVIDFFTRQLGSIYGIIDLEYDEGAITQLFTRISQDICKLKFFQEQATMI